MSSEDTSIDTYHIYKQTCQDLTVENTRLRDALTKLESFQNPETLTGHHLNADRRAQLAFVMIDNVRLIARAALKGEA